MTIAQSAAASTPSSTSSPANSPSSSSAASPAPSPTTGIPPTPPEPPQVIKRVADAGFRLFTFMHLHRYLDDTRRKGEVPYPNAIVLSLLPWAGDDRTSNSSAGISPPRPREGWPFPKIGTGKLLPPPPSRRPHTLNCVYPSPSGVNRNAQRSPGSRYGARFPGTGHNLYCGDDARSIIAPVQELLRRKPTPLRHPVHLRPPPAR